MLKYFINFSTFKSEVKPYEEMPPESIYKEVVANYGLLVVASVTKQNALNALAKPAGFAKRASITYCNRAKFIIHESLLLAINITKPHKSHAN